MKLYRDGRRRGPPGPGLRRQRLWLHRRLLGAGFVLIPLLGTQRPDPAGHRRAVVAAGLLRARPDRFRVLAPAGAALFALLAFLTPASTAPSSPASATACCGTRGLEQTVTILQGSQQRRMFLNGWQGQRHAGNGAVPPGRAAGAAPSRPIGAAPRQRDVLVIGRAGHAGAARAFPNTPWTWWSSRPAWCAGRATSTTSTGVVTSRGAPAHGRRAQLPDLTSKRYDVVMADVIRPQQPGARLYSWSTTPGPAASRRTG